MTAEPLVRCSGAGRTYGSGSAANVALQPADCEVGPGARIALVGPSGSGKSTLLHLMAGLDVPTHGEVTWPAIGSRDELRPGPVAVVFQGNSLLPPLTIEENVALPLVLAGEDDAEAKRETHGPLELVGLLDLRDKLPEEVSGGQAQRAAVARGLVGKPKLILADEPTGQLDRASATKVVDALIAAADAAGAALVIATHDPAVAAAMNDRWEIHSGRLQVPAKAMAA
jgi:putative ABC transport system ATP-binding protein/lipoprotein-releasing system ATP-binding protein